jgi:uncharacterized protein (TIGR02118 family)
VEVAAREEVAMVRVHVWVRRKEGMDPGEFRRYWLEEHAPAVLRGYEHLRGYTVNVVTRVPEGQEAPYDGVAELAWEDREGLAADMRSDAARRVTEDLARFASAFGLLFVESIVLR